MLCVAVVFVWMLLKWDLIYPLESMSEFDHRLLLSKFVLRICKLAIVQVHELREAFQHTMDMQIVLLLLNSCSNYQIIEVSYTMIQKSCSA